MEESRCGGGSRVLALLLAFICMLAVVLSMPTTGQAAGKQPTDIDVKCGTILSDDTVAPDCTIVVTYDDWSTDVAKYSNGNLSGNTGSIQLNGGYKAVTYCTEPSYATAYEGGAGTTMTVEGNGVCLTAGLTAKPVDRPTAASVMQMPTTGAPEGLSTVGVAAVAVGLLAVGVGLRRRDRI